LRRLEQAERALTGSPACGDGLSTMAITRTARANRQKRKPVSRKDRAPPDEAAGGKQDHADDGSGNAVFEADVVYRGVMAGHEAWQLAGEKYEIDNGTMMHKNELPAAGGGDTLPNADIRAATELFADTVREKILVWVARNVFKRQNGESRPPGLAQSFA
jgi:hypothetical protein